MKPLFPYHTSVDSWLSAISHVILQVVEFFLNSLTPKQSVFKIYYWKNGDILHVFSNLTNYVIFCCLQICKKWLYVTAGAEI